MHFSLLLVLSFCLHTCHSRGPPAQWFKGGEKETCDHVCESKGLWCDEDISGINVEKQMSKVKKCAEVYDTFKLPFEPIWDWRGSCIGTSLRSIRCATWSDNPEDRRFCKCVAEKPADEL
eukprot:NODE_5273_length_417_cov_97.005435_g4594_i0.p1 GENE.NODE_5273_length_417_cov_97.005435_g4594_i0~~NODE_5273_length_417_cov_97.005435_g4594_i0.p1  ORF type:complete len:138 (+),score=27.12 NODE_5273_length_417_cov_97.005435_g4594_i0:56-415(+)